MHSAASRPTVGVIAIGLGVVLVALIVDLPFGTSTWFGFASIYLVTGVLLGGVRLYGVVEEITPRIALGVAAVAVLVTIALRLWTVLTARPDLALVDATFVLLQFQVLVPFVAASATPIGVASGRERQAVALAVIVVPAVVALSWIAGGSGFGPGFAVVYHGLVLVAGFLAGVPLYLYGRSLREDGIPVPPSTSDPRSGTDS